MDNNSKNKDTKNNEIIHPAQKRGTETSDIVHPAQEAATDEYLEEAESMDDENKVKKENEKVVEKESKPEDYEKFDVDKVDELEKTKKDSPKEK